MIISGKKPYFADYFKKMATNRNEESGVIMKIQKRSGCLLFVIGAAMLAFVLTDLLGSNTSLFGQTSNVVGVIAGEEISYDVYAAKVDKLKELYSKNGGNYPDEQFREMAWNQMLQDKVFKKEQYQLGLQITPEELADLTTGANPDPMVIRNFQDPETKQYNPSTLIKFLEVDIQDDPEKYSAWLNFVEIPLIDQVESNKYDKMVKSAVYVTTLEANVRFEEEQNEISGLAVGLPYSTIADSTISYDDSDLKSHLKKNSAKYQQTASRDIDFVVLNVFPSKEDSAVAYKWANDKKEKFALAENDSIYIGRVRSSTQYNPEFLTRGSLPAALEQQLFSVELKTVIGPILNKETGSYGLYKVTEEGRDTIAQMRAEHLILPAPSIENEASELAKATILMNDLKAGRKDFATEAKNNFDGTADKGGDLGWIKETGFSTLPEEIKTQMFKSSAGDWFVKKTNRGIHIVHITQGKSYKTIKVGIVDKLIVPGMESDRAVERVAGEIQYQAQNNEDFEAVVEAQGSRIRVGANISPSNPSIQGIADADDVKTITRWLFNDNTEEGNISDVFRLQNKYVVAKVVAIREKGTASLDNMRDVIMQDYLVEKKSEILIKKINEALTKASDADGLAKELSSVVRQIPASSFASPQLTSIGNEPQIQGAFFAMKEGENTGAIKGQTGVYVVWHMGAVQTGDKMEFDVEERKVMLNQETSQMIDGGVLEAIRAKGNVEDFRYKFF
ncbi:MAG: peptidyl-prolyl cis-trans isomerase D [Bacteroidia bacterium]